jgi:hypothetical protein
MGGRFGGGIFYGPGRMRIMISEGIDVGRDVGLFLKY